MWKMKMHWQSVSSDLLSILSVAICHSLSNHAFTATAPVDQGDTWSGATCDITRPDQVTSHLAGASVMTPDLYIWPSEKYWPGEMKSGWSFRPNDHLKFFCPGETKKTKVKWHLIFPFGLLKIVSPDPKTVQDIWAKSNLAIPHIGSS